MGIMTLVIVLTVVGWLYDRARKRKQNFAMKVLVGVGAFFIGAALANILVQFIIDPIFLDRNYELRVYVSVPVLIACIWGTHVWLRKATGLNAPKDEGNRPLDADLMETKPDDKDQS